MPQLTVVSQAGKTVEKLTLKDEVFGIEPHKQAIFDVVQAQRAAMRQGTSKTKDRSEVSGGGRKPWRQKGTGRARTGSIRSPQWRGGGIVFGPTPRSYTVKLNQKVRQLALRSALSYHQKSNTLIVLDKLVVETPKTKDFKTMLDGLKIKGKVLFVAPSFNDKEILAARNIPSVQFSTASHVSVYDILNAKHLVLTKDAALALQEVLSYE
ncbi:MAG TPA: 50S ribosomal protein L4 [Acholeplasmataceae bacterium]|nr:50S ribosomal protein L4 [Acholeplasmataceae bacterium]